MPDPLVLKIISLCLQHLSLVSGSLVRLEAVKFCLVSTHLLTHFILLGEASNFEFSHVPPNSFIVFPSHLLLQAFLGAKAPPQPGHVCLTVQED